MNTKISKVKNKILNTSSIATTTVLNTKIGQVEQKIPNHAKYITTLKVKKLTAINFTERLKQVDLVRETDLDHIKITSK